jgi:sulfatase modifying factor 1
MRKHKADINWLPISIALGLCLLLMACSISRKKFANKNGKLNEKHGTPVTAKNLIDDFVFIEGSSFVMGLVEGIDTSSYYAPQRVEVASFYMKKYEITNYEYHQFVDWVKDSTAHSMSGHYLPANDKGERRIDWSQPIDWASPKLDILFDTGEDRFAGRRAFDASKLIYDGVNIYPDTLCWIEDFPYSYNEPMARNYFSHPAFNNYPVVGVNYHMANAYCKWASKHLLNNQYPPLRLPTQAEWEYAALGLPPEEVQSAYRVSEKKIYPWKGKFYESDKPGHEFSFHCNSGPLTDYEHEYQVFSYPSDGYVYAAPIYSFKPNGFGLYQMAGNASEWVDGPYSSNIKYGFEENISLYEKAIAILRETNDDEAAFWHEASQRSFQSGINAASWTLKEALHYRNIYTLDQIHVLSPHFLLDGYDEDMAITKGGSWADSYFYMQAGAQKIIPSDSLHSYLGFRPVMSTVQAYYNSPQKAKKKKARKNKLRKKE